MTPNGPSSVVTAVAQTVRAQLPIRLIIVSSSATAVAALWVAGGMRAWLVVLFALLVIAACARPDTVIPAVFLAAYAVAWVALTRRGVSVWLLAGALGVGGLHLGTAAAGTVPPRGELPGAVARRWLRRGAVVAGITIVVWLLALTFDTVDSAANAALAAAGLLAIAVAGYILVAGSHPHDH